MIDVALCMINDGFLYLGADQFAEYTEQAKEAILARDWDRLGDLMDANFALRRETYVRVILYSLSMGPRELWEICTETYGRVCAVSGHQHSRVWSLTSLVM